MAPPLVPAPSQPANPLVVGNGDDYSAVVAGKISRATGSFTHVSPGITEAGQFDDQGPQLANTFSLQLNSQFFSGSPACSGASVPSNCLAWEQFVYDTHSNMVFMQYWLINYANTCPSRWYTYSDDCYTNSPATVVSAGPVTAPDLASLKFVGSATSGGDDAVSLSTGSGTASLVSNPDSQIDLAKFWNTSEFNVFGDAGGGQANFGADTTLDPVTTLVASTSSAPTCTTEGFTAETNNLNLSGAPALGPQPSPTIDFGQTNGTGTTASCATSASSSPSITNPGPQPGSGKPADVAGKAITPLKINAISHNGALLKYSATGLPPGLAIKSSSGVISGTPTKAGTYSPRVTASAGSLSASTTFLWKITPCGHGCAVVTVTNPGSQSSTLGSATRLQIHASDSGFNKLTYRAAGLPAGLKINSSSGLISGKPTKAGSYSVTVKATDATADTSRAVSFSWKIHPKR